MLEQAHAVEDDASVHLELRLARSAQSHRAFAAAAARAAALSLEVRPEALQARQHVAVLCQLDLRLGVGRLGSHGEDVENETGAVENLDFEFGFDVAQLLGREFVVEDDHRDFAFLIFLGLDIGSYLLKFADADVGDAVRAVHPLGEATDGLGSRRLGQELQFVEVLPYFAFVLVLSDYAHEDGFACLGYVVVFFLHFN